MSLPYDFAPRLARRATQRRRLLTLWTLTVLTLPALSLPVAVAERPAATTQLATR